MMPIKTYKKMKRLYYILLYNKKLEISFQKGPEHETTSLNRSIGQLRFFFTSGIWRQDL